MLLYLQLQQLIDPQLLYGTFQGNAGLFIPTDQSPIAGLEFLAVLQLFALERALFQWWHAQHPFGKLHLARVNSLFDIEHLAHRLDALSHFHVIITGEIPAGSSVDHIHHFHGTGPHRLGIEAHPDAVNQHRVASARYDAKSIFIIDGIILLLGMALGHRGPCADIPNSHGIVKAVHADGMFTRSRVSLIVQRQARVVAGVMSPRFTAANMDCILFRTFADTFGCLFAAIGQHITDPLTADDLFYQLNDCLSVAPLQFQAVRIRFGENPVLITLDGKGHGPAAGDGINARPIQKLIDVQNGIEIKIQKLRPKLVDGFIFRLMGVIEFTIEQVVDVQHTAAPHRAGVSLGIEVHTNITVGADISFDQLKEKYDCLYLSIGAHTDKKTGIEGENSQGVISAVELLRRIGDDEMPDFTGQNIVVIGGGNVAMDVTRSSIRLGAAKVTCVYRRRTEDMTAQKEEVEGAIAEGAAILTLQAPLRIEANAQGHVTALWTQPQIAGEMDQQGRPRPTASSEAPSRIPADTIIVAIGQGIETHGFEQSGIKIQRGGRLQAAPDTQMPDVDGVFAGGDCVTGPATVIRAIAAGKVAAANIDEYLGFHHDIETSVQVPVPSFADLRPRGRVNANERDAYERKGDFQCIECSMTGEEATQEASRCLRCDHFGYGSFKGGRVEKW